MTHPGRYAVMLKVHGTPGMGLVVHSDSRVSHALAEAEQRRQVGIEVWVYDRISGKAILERDARE